MSYDKQRGSDVFEQSLKIDFIEVTPEMALKIAFAKQWWHDSSAKISEHLTMCVFQLWWEPPSQGGSRKSSCKMGTATAGWWYAGKNRLVVNAWNVRLHPKVDPKNVSWNFTGKCLHLWCAKPMLEWQDITATVWEAACHDLVVERRKCNKSCGHFFVVLWWDMMEHRKSMQ